MATRWRLQQRRAAARAARGVGALGAARRRPRGREGNEGGAYAHGAKVTGPRRTRRRGGAPVAETDDEHYCEHVKHFRRARVEAAYRASVDLLITAFRPLQCQPPICDISISFGCRPGLRAVAACKLAGWGPSPFRVQTRSAAFPGASLGGPNPAGPAPRRVCAAGTPPLRRWPR
jgi:hypothetical protein